MNKAEVLSCINRKIIKRLKYYDKTLIKSQKYITEAFNLIESKDSKKHEDQFDIILSYDKDEDILLKITSILQSGFVNLIGEDGLKALGVPGPCSPGCQVYSSLTGKRTLYSDGNSSETYFPICANCK